MGYWRGILDTHIVVKGGSGGLIYSDGYRNWNVYPSIRIF